jgi:hypothetical protein
MTEELANKIKANHARKELVSKLRKYYAIYDKLAVCEITNQYLMNCLQGEPKNQIRDIVNEIKHVDGLKGTYKLDTNIVKVGDDLICFNVRDSRIKNFERILRVNEMVDSINYLYMKEI